MIASKEQKILWIKYGITLAIALFILRLGYLQILKNSYYSQISKDNSIRLQNESAPRGLIKDRTGFLIVKNRPSYNVYIHPQEIENLNYVIYQLSQILNLPQEQIRKKIYDSRSPAYEPLVIKREVDLKTISIIAEHKENLAGVDYQVEQTRQYPENVWATHLLGYVNEISQEELDRDLKNTYHPGSYIGKEGVEKSYDDLLRGIDGAKYLEVSARGRLVGELEEKNPRKTQPGSDIYLTVDLSLQAQAESLLSNYSAGAIVALNPQNGEILALVSKPTFDPNWFAGILTPEQWKEISTDPNHPLLNRCIQGLYPPGSTFKLLVAGAALEDKLIDSHTKFQPCTGGFQFGNRFFRCWKPEGHGSLDLKEAIVQSCDVYFYQLGLKLGLERLSEFASQSGFGEKTDIDLPGEMKGFVPTIGFYDRSLGANRWPRSLVMNLAIGQGEILTTPLQLLCFYTALSNGGVCHQPHILKEVISTDGKSFTLKSTMKYKLPFSSHTINILNEALKDVVNSPSGTGQLAKVTEVFVAGKTGTAQNPHGLEHSWFVCWAPFENPQIAVAVIVENAGHGGSVAAPLAGRIISNYLQKESQYVETSETEPEE